MLEGIGTKSKAADVDSDSLESSSDQKGTGAADADSLDITSSSDSS
jgi:hypothetical protein